MSRFFRTSSTVRVIALLTGAYLAFYIVWRLTSTLNPDALAFSVLVLFAEAQGVVSFVLFAFMTWDLGTAFPFQLKRQPRVDIFVPTYDENLEILEATLTGCQNVRYPHNTYVLDDGRRPEVAALAMNLGCSYLTRADNRHAKAGNINAALPQTSAEFVAILDADMVPQPDFLDKTLGYFVDEHVALVQLPQDFYNLDSVQHTREEDPADAWHEQDLFYRVIQPGKNRWNAAFWCGSPSVVRRAALESVNGVATETVTEDIHTTVRLHARGWKTVFHNENLAYGLAPQTLHAFSVQRLRWAQGSMQLLRSRENPLIVPGLTLAQRLNYFASMSTYFEAYQKLVFLIAAPVVLITGLLPMRVSGLEFLAHWLPYVALIALANGLLGRGHYRHLMAERYNLLKTFTFLRASLVLAWPRTLGFRVTPKQVDQSVYAQERLNLLPHAAVILLVGFSIAVGVINLVWGLTTAYSDLDIVAVTVLWSLANAGLMYLAVRDVLRRRHNRQDYRFPAHLSASVSVADGMRVPATTKDLSRYGVGLGTRLDVDLGKSANVVLALPDGPLNVIGQVVYRSALRDGEHHLGVRFAPLNKTAQRRLLTYLFVTASRQQRARKEDSITVPSSSPTVDPWYLGGSLDAETTRFDLMWRLSFVVDDQARRVEARAIQPGEAAAYAAVRPSSGDCSGASASTQP